MNGMMIRQGRMTQKGNGLNKLKCKMTQGNEFNEDKPWKNDSRKKWIEPGNASGEERIK